MNILMKLKKSYISIKIQINQLNFLFRINRLTTAQKKLIVKLTNSLDYNDKKPFDLKSLFGAWKGDKTSKEIIDEIKASRVEPKDVSL